MITYVYICISEVQLCLFLISYAPYRNNKQPSADTSSTINHSGTKCSCIELHNMDSVPPSKDPLVTHWLADQAATLELLWTLEVVRNRKPIHCLSNLHFITILKSYPASQCNILLNHILQLQPSEISFI